MLSILNSFYTKISNGSEGKRIKNTIKKIKLAMISIKCFEIEKSSKKA